jgi:putative transferase (TIGR04331 family)
MSKPSQLLVTTADERSWPTYGSVLFLGTWCCKYDRMANWEKLKGEVVPYHWDDRNKLYADYLYIRELYEVLLTELSDALNSIHGTRHSCRYWRILVGPWLLYFTQMVFDRWSMIQYAIENYNICGTFVLDFSPDQVVPKNMDDFRNISQSDYWNHAIYSRILTGWTSVVCDRIPCDKCDTYSPDANSSYMHSFWKGLRNITYSSISRVSQFFQDDIDAFFISTYMPRKQEFLLQIALGQIPAFNTQIPPPSIAYDLNSRKDLRIGLENQNNFENCVRSLIVEQIPTVYLEGYCELQRTLVKLPWPNRPKVIFTSTSYNSDDVFKAWAALLVDRGTPLVIGQHGGNMGSALFSSTEDHEVAISDRYLTWGWSDGHFKQYPNVALKLVGRGSGAWNPKGHLLLVSSVMPRYSYVMGSFTVAESQVNSNLEDQYRFIRSLQKEIYNKLAVRLYIPDWGWSQVSRWRDQFPDVYIDQGSGKIEPLVKNCRLYVATYNATTFLESLSQNIPTIVFWNPKHWELRPGAVPYFDKLRQIGILHACPEDAAAKVNEIWGSVEEWWSGSDVQDVRSAFCSRFARSAKQPIVEMLRAISGFE